MERLRAAWLRTQALFRRRQFERDLQDEVAFHLAMREEQHQREGMSDAQAQSAARREFGNVTRVQEKTRTLWTFTSLETWWADIRYAVRMLRKSSVVTFVVVLSLAVGIGANTAIFSIINAAMLKSLPVDEPQQLQLLTWTAKEFPTKVIEGLEGTGREEGGHYWSYSLPTYGFEYIRDHNHSFDSVVAFAANSAKGNIGLDGQASSAVVQAVSGDFFNAMRISPVRGRGFTAADDQTNAAPVAMVSYHFWRSRMGEDGRVLGKTMSVDGQSVTIVGVLPRDFYGFEPGNRPDVWTTLSQYVSELNRVDDYNIRNPKVWWLGVVGRKKRGVSREQARAEMRVLFDQALHSQNADLAKDAVAPLVDVTSFARGVDELRENFSGSLFLMMTMVALVLLIACANVAALLLARATARQREIAVRLSLGAARWRVVRQLLTESVLLATIGAGTGLIFARWLTVGLMTMLNTGRNAIDLPVTLDGHVLLFTVAVAVLCGVAFGVAPALRVIGVDVFPVLKQSQSQVLHGGNRFVPGKVLVGGQVALCLLLLVNAGLLARTLQHLQRVQLGFDHHNLISFRVQPGLNGYKGARLITYYDELQRRMESIPGVLYVGLSELGPVGSGQSVMELSLPGYTQPDKPARLFRHLVDTSYFTTLGMSVLTGRGIGASDLEGAKEVAVVNEKAAAQYFHGDNPVGHTIEFDKGRLINIVGVVSNAKYNSIRDDFRPTVYFAYKQRPEFATMMTFLVRTSADERSVMISTEREAAAVDKDVPVLALRTETEIINGALVMERLLALLSTMFAGLALLLACVGLYGTIGYTVIRRTNEIGIRMALGAARESILAMVLCETLVVVAGGLLIGLPLALLATRLLKAQLFEVSQYDPATVAFAVGAIVLVTLASGFLPARRASRVDPMVALRCE